MMLNKDDIHYNSYFGIPEKVDGIGEIYPISVPDYKRFSELFNKYMLYSVNGLKNLGKLSNDVDIDLFNFIVQACSEFEGIEEILENNEGLVDDKDIESIKNNIDLLKKYAFKISEMEELISLILKKEVKYDSIDRVFVILKDLYGNKICADNFDTFRDIVMIQNVIYEPLTVKGKLAQRELEKEFKKREKNSQPIDFLAMVILVDMYSNGDVNTYTYYKLSACYEILNKKIIGDLIQRFIAQGVDRKLINLGEELNINKNPYDKSNFFKSHKVSTTL